MADPKSRAENAKKFRSTSRERIAESRRKKKASESIEQTSTAAPSSILLPSVSTSKYMPAPTTKKQQCERFAQFVLEKSADFWNDTWKTMKREAKRIPINQYSEMKGELCRYTDMICLDDTRVKLSGQRNWIHANFVKLNGINKMILAQGPLEHTVEDFWRMIVDEEVGSVIQLCQLVEESEEKCSAYFPLELNGTLQLESSVITTIDITMIFLADSNQQVQRSKLSVHANGKPDRIVQHFWWKNWPDRGIPEVSLGPVHLLSAATIPGIPLLVHCSAGIGRTGCLGLLNIFRTALDSDHLTDPISHLKELREQRAKSVQNIEQLLFTIQVFLLWMKHKKLLSSKMVQKLVQFDMRVDKIKAAIVKDKVSKMAAPQRKSGGGAKITHLPSVSIASRNASSLKNAMSSSLVKVREQSSAASVKHEQFMNGSSSVYIEQMYDAWQHDPSSVHASWDAYFRNVEAGAAPGQAFRAPLQVVPSFNYGTNLPAAHTGAMTSLSERMGRGAAVDLSSSVQSISDHFKIQLLIRSYQTRGHNIADLDPLGINSADLDDTIPPALELSFYGFGERDLDCEFLLPPTTFISGEKKSLTLREIIHRLKQIYGKATGVEYMHINNLEQQDWIRQRFEAPRVTELSHDQKKVLFKRLIRSTKFEEFLAKKWPNEKRFGLEGCEVLIPAIKQVIDSSSSLGVDSVVIGMPHRGRLNVLANVCRQPLSTILSQFSTLDPADEGSGDVKYHLGVCIERLNRQSQRNVKIAVVANPSHLEAVDPVVQGKVRAEAFYAGDNKCDRTMAILMHGDAAFSGQGVVLETFNLGDHPDFTTSGAIHIVVNNQIGFTTDPRSSRSSPYCTDVGRVVGCPIFHVNVDDPEAVMHVCNVASDWRKTFKKDVIIDLVSYRRHGHNELDEPMFTQPLMYQKIKQTKTALEKYQEQIISDGVANEQYVKKKLTKYGQILEDEYENAQKVTFVRNRDWLDSSWDDFFKKRDPLKLPSTGIEQEEVNSIIDKFSSVTEGFNLHPGLERTLKGRKQMVADNSVDWSIGEALAFGSLLKEGTHVRLSGQDVDRGTFSHRHHVLHDQKVDQKVYNPLNDLSEGQAEYTVCNSSLSEYAVLGFELGYSMVNPNSLVIWEAQFGNFSYTAQCIIDQFISPGQSKWIRQSGLVMLLPHGYEGMGPEHSSCRPERFLQMCNEDDQIDLEKTAFGGTFEAQQLHDTNWIVANCTTPANIYHLLRRQVSMPFRKPAVVMSPKSLLRHPMARSPIVDFLPGTHFQRVIPDAGAPSKDTSNVQRLVFCTGKVYYDLLAARKHVEKESNVAICRVEQVSPFPYDLIQEECRKYPGAELIWAQEEHKNMGAWTFVQPRFNSLLQPDGRVLRYAGRTPSASPATGNKYTHVQEQKEMTSKVFDVVKSKLEGFKA